MISFSQFLAERKCTNGTYASVRFTDDSNVQLSEIQRKFNIKNPLSSDKFHSTLIYSRVELHGVESHDVNLKLDTTAFTMREWKSRDGTVILVLTYESEWMNERHEYYRSIGGTHDYDSYTPHITLSYDIGEKAGTLDGTKLELNLVIKSENVEELDLNWS